MSKHERLNSQRVGFFRSPFDKLRANGKILNSTALGSYLAWKDGVLSTISIFNLSLKEFLP